MGLNFRRFVISVVGRDSVGKSGLIQGLIHLQKNNLAQEVQFPEEVERGYTLYNRFYRLNLENHTTQFIDTPGNSNFLPKIQASLEASHGAIFVVSSHGVFHSSFRIWESILKSNTPRMIFVNMFEDANSFDNVLHGIEQHLDIKPLVLFAPHLEEGKLVGVIDIMHQKLISDKGQKDLPDSAKEAVEIYREMAIEQLADFDDAIMEKYIEGEDVPIELLDGALKQGIRSYKIAPIFTGCTKSLLGIAEMDEFINVYFPSHCEGPAVVGVDPDDENTVLERLPLPDQPFSGMVFKTKFDRYAGKLSIMLVVSGTLNKGDKIINSTNNKKITVHKMAFINGDKLEETTKVQAGDIVALEKVDDVDTNQSVSSAKEPILLEAVNYPVPRCTFRLEIPENQKDEKVMESLHKICDEDPSIRLHKNKETGDILLSGMGVMHLEITKEHLKNVYDVEIDLSKPHIAYHETIGSKIEVQGRHKKQSGGHGQFGDVKVRFEPLPNGSGFEFVNKITGGVVPRNYIPAVERGIIDALQHGHLAGFPVVDVRATLYDGSYHSVDSSDLAFQMAGKISVRNALPEAKSKLMEPIMELEVDLPESDVGKMSKEIASRRGRVLGYENKPMSTVITAEIPLSEMTGFSASLREKNPRIGPF